ncbi:MAG: 6-carboxytetrahydropterin synthase QueD [Candidatus Eremiobacteraeota bacterium]|nr:6-carboxytetrahydropterin synthase QueD [Candidatus Eremiobacteraeota bacterium]
MQIRKQFTFEAAHVLPHHQGKCASLHGHSYRLEVGLGGDVQTEGPQRGMIEDFEVLASIVRRTVIDQLDHNSLNALIENPTCEVILGWIWERLKPELPRLEELVLWETSTCCAVLRAGDFL